eukprot:692283-Prorocentrum_minimum.AAC.1
MDQSDGRSRKPPARGNHVISASPRVASESWSRNCRRGPDMNLVRFGPKTYFWVLGFRALASVQHLSVQHISGRDTEFLTTARYWKDAICKCGTSCQYSFKVHTYIPSNRLLK